MDDSLKHALINCETDLDGVKSRFCGDEALYIRCLAAFLHDPTMKDLKLAIDSELWDDAFTAAHALKGVAGNMGFVPLYHATANTVVQIRNGRIAEVRRSYLELQKYYHEITDVISKYCFAGGTEE